MSSLRSRRELARHPVRRATSRARRAAPDRRRLGRHAARPRRARLRRPARPHRQDPARPQGVATASQELRNEFVVQADGEVAARAPEAVNPNIATGEVEIQVESLRILSRSTPLPFQVGDDTVEETTRLRYRWLDMRGERMQRNLRLRTPRSPASAGRWTSSASSTSGRRR